MEETRGLTMLLPFWILIAPVAWALMTMPKAGERSARSMVEDRHRAGGMHASTVGTGVGGTAVR